MGAVIRSMRLPSRHYSSDSGLRRLRGFRMQAARRRLRTERTAAFPVAMVLRVPLVNQPTDRNASGPQWTDRRPKLSAGLFRHYRTKRRVRDQRPARSAPVWKALPGDYRPMSQCTNRHFGPTPS